MGLIARSPIDVMLGEMAYGVSDATRYADLQAIASVISNRATALGVTADQVVANQSQFNAYGKSLPPGASSYRDLAQAAWDDVMQNGPTHSGLFYATPSAVKGLPSGLKQVTEVEGGHRYFEDPYGRAIKTSVGYRAPVDIATARAAAAQRMAFETASVSEDGMPTPQARPDILNISQNPALLAGVPLSQVDPNISTGVPSVSALTGMPDAAVVQRLAQNNPVASEADLAAAASRFGEDPSAMISSPASLQAALSRLNTPASNPIDIMQAMNQAIAESVKASPPSFDTARMADNAPLSEADKALQGMMKEAAANSITDRFAGPARPVTKSVTTTSIPGQVPAGSYVPGSMPVMDVSGVPANRVQSITVKPGDMINSPETLAAALGSFPDAMAAQRTVAEPAMATADAVKGDRIGTINTAGMDQGRFAPNTIDTSQMDQSRFGPDPMQTADAALRDAISRETAPANQPADIDGFADAIAAQRGPTSGVNSAEMQAMQGSAERQLQDAIAAKTASMAASSNLAEGIQAQRSVVTPSAVPSTDVAADPGGTDETQNSPTTTSRITSQPTMTPQQIAGYKQAAESLRQAGIMNIGQQPPTDLSGELPTDFDVLGTAATTPEVPALETVEIAKQPTIAPPVEDVASITAPAASVTKSMPAVQQRQSSAMDVWSGKAQTGVATDGSTVSRMGNKIGRYVPEFDYTVFSQDDGATWSSPVAGNQLAPATTNSQMASIQPAVSKSLLSRLAAVLTGVAPTTASPTDAGPSMGLDGGMSVGRDGPAGAPGGWGPGGSIGSSGPAGGYGSTKGIDPNGTR